jgi:hypothetical protein
VKASNGIVAPEAAVAKPGLFIRREGTATIVYWSTNYQGFGLEFTTNLVSSASWTNVNGPYYLNGGYIEYHETGATMLPAKYFRLKYPTVIYLNPLSPELSLSLNAFLSEVVLSWSTNYSAYTLETTTNLNAPVIWAPATSPLGTATNGHIEFHQSLDPRIPQRFFRLRWP